ncbi:MAG TPA: LPS export ABC transporter permease LptG [Kiloniellaceae bacterium]|nr:LPS export ABC transporter permease LptG [Kiloniellaceae bacterium]
MSLAQTAPSMRRSHVSTTLSTYIARQFFTWLLTFFFALIAIIYLITFVEMLDRVSGKDVSLSLTLLLSFLKLPHLSQEVMPFTVLFASMANFWRMNRAHELVITRSAGVSVWQSLFPILLVGIVVGLFTMTVLNPIAASLLGRYEQLELQYIKSDSSRLSLSRSGLWLRQVDGDGQAVINAERLSADRTTLERVIIFRFSPDGTFRSRIDAAHATLADGAWALQDAWLSKPEETSLHFDRLSFATELTYDQIHESFSPPETISFWALPAFIRIMEGAGFSGLQHKLQLHRLYSMPVLFVAMILIAASFSLRPQRRGRVAVSILAGIVTGFLLYFVSNLVFALGLSGKVPVILAAWTPAGVSLMFGISLLLHFEDG